MGTTVLAPTRRPFARAHTRDAVRTPAILSIAAACRSARGVDLATGIPAEPADPLAVDGASCALAAGENSYAEASGIAPLRAAIAEKLRRQNGLHYDTDDELVVTSGVTGGFAASVFALFEPGDEILVPEPFFGWHLNLIRLAGLEPRPVAMSRGLRLTRRDLEGALTERTRGIVLCTPTNPSGRGVTATELACVAELARDQELIVITDEQYEQFCYDGTRHISPASVEDLRERTVTLMGFSKSHAVTGWRIGYAAGPAELIDPLRRLHQLLYICPPTPLQHGVARAALSPDTGHVHRIATLASKRNELATALSGAGFRVTLPSAGFFILAEAVDARFGGPTGSELALSLLERTGVAAVPGSDFFAGDAGDRYLRFCFAKSDAAIAEACRRLRRLSTNS